MTRHDVPPGAHTCSCGADAVTCQGCGHTVCGDLAVYLNIRNPVTRGNIGPCCFAQYGLGHGGAA